MPSVADCLKTEASAAVAASASVVAATIIITTAEVELGVKMEAGHKRRHEWSFHRKIPFCPHRFRTTFFTTHKNFLHFTTDSPAAAAAAAFLVSFFL